MRFKRMLCNAFSKSLLLALGKSVTPKRYPCLKIDLQILSLMRVATVTQGCIQSKGQ
jgi:hypothetical protein